MDTLAEVILERDKERGARIPSAVCKRRATRSQPKSAQPLRGGPSLDDFFVARRLQCAAALLPPRASNSPQTWASKVSVFLFHNPLRRRPLRSDDRVVTAWVEGMTAEQTTEDLRGGAAQGITLQALPGVRAAGRQEPAGRRQERRPDGPIEVQGLEQEGVNHCGRCRLSGTDPIRLSQLHPDLSNGNPGGGRTRNPPRWISCPG